MPGWRGSRHAEVGGYPKPGSTASAGLKAFSFDSGKNRDFFFCFFFFAFPAESSLVCQTRAFSSRVILWQSRKPALLIIQEHVPLPVFHAALPSGPTIFYTAGKIPRNSHVIPSSFSRVTSQLPFVSSPGNCLEQQYPVSPFSHKHQRNDPVVGIWVKVALSLVPALLEQIYPHQKNVCIGIHHYLPDLPPWESYCIIHYEKGI